MLSDGANHLESLFSGNTEKINTTPVKLKKQRRREGGTIEEREPVADSIRETLPWSNIEPAAERVAQAEVLNALEEPFGRRGPPTALWRFWKHSYKTVRGDEENKFVVMFTRGTGALRNVILQQGTGKKKNLGLLLFHTNAYMHRAR